MPLVMSRTAERTKTLTAEMMKDMAALKHVQPAPDQPAKQVAGCISKNTARLATQMERQQKNEGGSYVITG